MKQCLIFIVFSLSLTVNAQQTVDNDTIAASIFNEPINLHEVLIETRSKNIDSRGIGNIRMNMRQLQVSPLFLGERDIIKTLQFLPGVSAGMEGSSQLNIRGGTNDQTLYLMDDVPVYNQNHTFGFLSMFNSNAIGSVDLYKGGIPAQYGGKLSGVVQIDLKDGDFKKHFHSVSLGVLAGTIASEGYIIKDKLSYLIAGRHSLIDLLFNSVMALSGMGIEGIVMMGFYDLNGKLTWKFNDNTKLSWQFYSGYDDLYGLNKINEYEKVFDKFGFGWKTSMSSLRFTSQIKPDLSLASTLYYSGLNNFNYYKYRVKTPEYKHEIANDLSSLLDEFGGKVSMNYKTNENNTLQYGLEGIYQTYIPEYIRRNNNGNKIEYNTARLKLFKLSGYFNDEFRYNQWLFSIGLRSSLFDNGSNHIFVVEPRIKVNTYVGGKNKLMLAYDRMYQPVHTINEMNYNVQVDFWIPFKETVLPHSHQVSLGWKNYTTSNLNFLIEAYYKSINNLLLIKNMEYYLDYHTDYEQGKGNSMGAEFMIEYAKNRFTSWIAYTLSKSTRTFEGKTYPFKYDAPHDISAHASYVVHKKPETIRTISLNMQFRNGYPYYVPEVSYPGMGLPTLSNGYTFFDNMFIVDHIPQYPNIRIKNYFRVDANFTVEKKRKNGSITWQFSLLNVTNQQNPYAIYKKDGKHKAFILMPVLPSFSVTRNF